MWHESAMTHQHYLCSVYIKHNTFLSGPQTLSLSPPPCLHPHCLHYLCPCHSSPIIIFLLIATMAIIKKGYAVIDTQACTVTVTRSDADPVYWHAEPVRPGDGPNRINIVGEALEKQDLYWRQEIGKNLVQFLDKSIKNCMMIVDAILLSANFLLFRGLLQTGCMA
jgi:hypothetical protein